MERCRWRDKGRRTLFRAIESDEELLHVVVHKVDFIVGHQSKRFQRLVSYQEELESLFDGHAQFHNIGLNPAFSWVTVLGWPFESIPAVQMLKKKDTHHSVVCGGSVNAQTRGLRWVVVRQEKEGR